MPNSRGLLGQTGEAIARAHLEERGYIVLATNYRCPWGEVDIVTEKGDEIAFVEVRTRRSRTFGSPEESVTATKRQRLVSTAYHYLQEHDLSQPWRIDLVAIEIDARGAVKRVSHLENVVSEEGLPD